MVEKDNYREFLQSAKYSVLPMPQEGISPLMLMGKEKPEDELLEVLGGVEDMFSSDVNLPEIGEDMKVANISGKKTGRLSCSLGLEIINKFLQGFQAKVGLNISSLKADTVEVIFSDVFSNQVMLLPLRNYIQNAKLKNKGYQDYLDSKGKTFIITEVLKTSQLKMKVYDHNGKAVGVEAEVATPASGHFSAENDNEMEKILSYEGDSKVIFAIKVIPVWCQEDEFKIGLYTTRGRLLPEYTILSPDSLTKIK